MLYSVQQFWILADFWLGLLHYVQDLSEAGAKGGEIRVTGRPRKSLPEIVTLLTAFIPISRNPLLQAQQRF